MRRTLPLLTAVLVLLLAPAARASWFGAQAVDGPGDIERLGDVDLARDGTGGVVYVKRDAGVPQVFLSRLVEGDWRPPERVSGGDPVTEASLSAAEGNRLVMAWIAGGDVFGLVVERGGPIPAPARLSSGGGASGVAVDMGINGTAYAVWAQPGTGGSDVRAARLMETSWQSVEPPLDVDPNQSAGTGAGRPRVAVSAEGNAVATWGETHPDGRAHVVGRRLTGLNLSVAPQDLTLADFEGQAAGGADSPDISIEDDGSFAWVVFRQDVGGRSRSIARRLLGSQFEAPTAIDGGATSFDPQIALNGRGLGEAVVATAENTVVGAYLDKFDVFQPGVRLDATGSGAPPSPVVAISERGDAVAAWRIQAADGSSAGRARRKAGEEGFEGEFPASRPDLGPVAPGQVRIAADRSGNTAVVMLQGGPGAGWVTAAVYDRPPGRPVAIDSSRFQRRDRLRLRWLAGSELWGPQRYRVFVDGRDVGGTDRTTFVAARTLRPGAHRWQVEATDRRGQSNRGRTRVFRVDPRAPRMSVSVRRAGAVVRVSVRATDGRGSGVKLVAIDFGDGSRPVRRRHATHRYGAGRHRLTVRAVDRAGNVARRTVTLRIGR